MLCSNVAAQCSQNYVGHNKLNSPIKEDNIWASSSVALHTNTCKDMINNLKCIKILSFVKFIITDDFLFFTDRIW